MNYQETTEWLFNQLPMFQQQGASAYKKDLSNSLALAKHLNHPENKFKSIHIAGTNGKGSTSSMLASILQEAGYKIGLYTSPHLKDFRERIKINGQEVSEDYIVDFVKKNRLFFEDNQLSFFEMTVGLAFQYFADEKVDIAIIEVGMGGRLDSTNIITPLVSVITNIGLDHTQFLGNTLELIAAEKAGIIKQNVPVVIGEYISKTKNVFTEIAQKNNASIYFAQENDHEDLPCDLLGNYQIQNKKTVLQTINLLKDYLKVSEGNIKLGLLNVVKNTGLLGRWQQLGKNPKIICDTAHNEHGLKIVMEQIKNQKFNQLRIVLGVVNDKDLDLILPLFPKKAFYYFCKPNISRGLDSAILKQKALNYDLKGIECNSVSEAYTLALKESNQDDFIYIGGSTFVVAEIV
ncbi:folylpolyglutamate synthase/dihydrofolate synthase family protein [uncultured Flavobacterium sp.]|uniref:bifunctional folylpolyglutamate synthase/dihydrofolate synthase n=1 Tax=uncultured Flavobacterium sp. TaxID=165435 RepID=UPI0030C7C616